MTKTLTSIDLRQFTGTELWHRHPLMRRLLYTDGVKHVAEHGEAYWLIDEIAFSQEVDVIKCEEFQHWKLAVQADSSAILECEDGNGKQLFSKRIAFTDFPLPEITFYVRDNVLMLPSEY